MMIRMVVVLPAPFAPTKPNISPGRTVNDTPSSARFAAPKLLRRSYHLPTCEK